MIVVATVLVAAGVVFYWERTHAKGGLVAFDVRTGQTRWRVSAPTGSAHIHAVGASQVVISGADSCNRPSGEAIASYALADGARRWTEPWKGVCFDYGSATAVVDGMFVIDGRHGPELVRVRDGSSARALAAPGGAEVTASGIVALHGDDVTASPIADGTPTWQAHVAGRPELRSVDETAVLLVGDPVRLSALDRRTGAHLWRRGLPFAGGYGGATGAADGVVTVSGPIGESPVSPYETYAIDERTGRILWKRRRVRPDPATPLLAVGGDVAVFGDRARDGSPTIVALDLRSGRTRWTVRPPWRSSRPLEGAVGDGMVILTDGHRLVAFAQLDGAIRWNRRWPSGAGTPVIAGRLVLVPYTRSGFPFYDE
jgi:outer membrane protein assembly factor BamB